MPCTGRAKNSRRRRSAFLALLPLKQGLSRPPRGQLRAGRLASQVGRLLQVASSANEHLPVKVGRLEASPAHA